MLFILSVLVYNVSPGVCKDMVELSVINYLLIQIQFLLPPHTVCILRISTLRYFNIFGLSSTYLTAHR